MSTFPAVLSPPSLSLSPFPSLSSSSHFLHIPSLPSLLFTFPPSPFLSFSSPPPLSPPYRVLPVSRLSSPLLSSPLPSSPRLASPRLSFPFLSSSQSGEGVEASLSSLSSLLSFSDSSAAISTTAGERCRFILEFEASSPSELSERELPPSSPPQELPARRRTRTLIQWTLRWPSPRQWRQK